MTFLVWILRHRQAVLCASFLIALGLLPGALRLETDNSPEVFFVQKSDELAAYRTFQETFGSDELVRVVLTGSDLWTPESLAWLTTLEEKIGQLSQVETVGGLVTHYRRFWEEWPPDPARLRQEARSNPLDRSLGWIDSQAETITVLVSLDVSKDESEETLEQLRRLAADPPGDVQANLTGLPVLNRVLDGSSREVQRRFFPLLIAFAVLLLAGAFRTVRGVLLPLALVTLSELGLLAAMGYAGVRLNLVLAILPPLLFVIALATAVHLLVGYREARQERGPYEAIISTYRDKGWAVLWTGLTTLVGFASLATSRVGPVRSLGLWAALGIAWMTLTAFLVYPALLATASRGARVPDRRLDAALGRRGRRWADWAARRRVAIRSCALALALIALAGLPRLRLQSNALHYLPPDHPVRTEIQELEAQGIGMAALELVIELPASRASFNSFLSVEALGQLSILAIDLREQALVLGVVGAGDILDDAVRVASQGAVLASRRARHQALEELRRRSPEVLEQFVSPDGRRSRLTLLTEITGHAQLQTLLRATRRLARESFPAARIRLTGEYPLLLAAQRYLFQTLALSLSLTVVAVAIIFYLLIRNGRLTLLALFPNLWPVAGVLGLMGWLQVPLDIATVMVASMVLGLAVDDTIHSLGHFRELAPQMGAFEAVAATLERTAPAYVVTGLILTAGFAVCSLSEFAPTVRFGGLAAAAIGLAVLGDLLLLPAVLASAPGAAVARWGKESGVKGHET